jgi:hypothetical protein
MLIVSPVSTGDIIAISFGLAATIIGVVTAVFSRKTNTSEGPSDTLYLFEINLIDNQLAVRPDIDTNPADPQEPITEEAIETSMGSNNDDVAHKGKLTPSNHEVE